MQTIQQFLNIQIVESTKGMFIRAPKVADQYIKNPKVNDKRMKYPLSKVLDNTCHTPHPFVIQYSVQKCCEEIENEDDFKNHMMNVNQYSQDMINNYEV
jgi:hypothetical protein